ncbi:hypothetical protein OAory_01114520, partial [Aspergillus oryzae]
LCPCAWLLPSVLVFCSSLPPGSLWSFSRSSLLPLAFGGVSFFAPPPCPSGLLGASSPSRLAWPCAGAGSFPFLPSPLSLVGSWPPLVAPGPGPSGSLPARAPAPRLPLPGRPPARPSPSRPGAVVPSSCSGALLGLVLGLRPSPSLPAAPWRARLVPAAAVLPAPLASLPLLPFPRSSLPLGSGWPVRLPARPGPAGPFLLGPSWPSLAVGGPGLFLCPFACSPPAFARLPSPGLLASAVRFSFVGFSARRPASRARRGRPSSAVRGAFLALLPPPPAPAFAPAVFLPPGPPVRGSPPLRSRRRLPPPSAASGSGGVSLLPRSAPSAPSPFLGSGGRLVARLPLPALAGRAPPAWRLRLPLPPPGPSPGPAPPACPLARSFLLFGWWCLAVLRWWRALSASLRSRPRPRPFPRPVRVCGPLASSGASRLPPLAVRGPPGLCCPSLFWAARALPCPGPRVLPLAARSGSSCSPCRAGARALPFLLFPAACLVGPRPPLVPLPSLPFVPPPVAPPACLARCGLRPGPGGLAPPPRAGRWSPPVLSRPSPSSPVSVGAPAAGSFPRVGFLARPPPPVFPVPSLLRRARPSWPPGALRPGPAPAGAPRPLSALVPSALLVSPSVPLSPLALLVPASLPPAAPCAPSCALPPSVPPRVFARPLRPLVFRGACLSARPCCPSARLVCWVVVPSPGGPGPPAAAAPRPLLARLGLCPPLCRPGRRLPPAPPSFSRLPSAPVGLPAALPPLPRGGPPPPGLPPSRRVPRPALPFARWLLRGPPCPLPRLLRVRPLSPCPGPGRPRGCASRLGWGVRARVPLLRRVALFGPAALPGWSFPLPLLLAGARSRPRRVLARCPPFAPRVPRPCPCCPGRACAPPRLPGSAGLRAGVLPWGRARVGLGGRSPAPGLSCPPGPLLAGRALRPAWPAARASARPLASWSSPPRLAPGPRRLPSPRVFGCPPVRAVPAPGGGRPLVGRPLARSCCLRLALRPRVPVGPRPLVPSACLGRRPRPSGGGSPRFCRAPRSSPLGLGAPASSPLSSLVPAAVSLRLAVPRLPFSAVPRLLRGLGVAPLPLFSPFPLSAALVASLPVGLRLARSSWALFGPPPWRCGLPARAVPFLSPARRWPWPSASAPACVPLPGRLPSPCPGWRSRVFPLPRRRGRPAAPARRPAWRSVPPPWACSRVARPLVPLLVVVALLPAPLRPAVGPGSLCPAVGPGFVAPPASGRSVCPAPSCAVCRRAAGSPSGPWLWLLPGPVLPAAPSAGVLGRVLFSSCPPPPLPSVCPALGFPGWPRPAPLRGPVRPRRPLPSAGRPRFPARSSSSPPPVSRCPPLVARPCRSGPSAPGSVPSGSGLALRVGLAGPWGPPRRRGPSPGPGRRPPPGWGPPLAGFGRPAGASRP